MSARGYRRKRPGVEQGKSTRSKNAKPRTLPELRRDALDLMARVNWWGRRNERAEGEVFRVLAMFIAQHLFVEPMTREQMLEALRWRLHDLLSSQYGILGPERRRRWPGGPALTVIQGGAA